MQKLASVFSCRIELRYRNSAASTDPRCDGCHCSKQDRRQCHRRAEHQSKHLPPLTCSYTYSNILLHTLTCSAKSTLLPRTVQHAPVVSCAIHIYNLALVSPKKHLNPILLHDTSLKRIKSNRDENTLIWCFKTVWLADLYWWWWSVMGFHHQQWDYHNPSFLSPHGQ